MYSAAGRGKDIIDIYYSAIGCFKRFKTETERYLVLINWHDFC